MDERCNEVAKKESFRLCCREADQKYVRQEKFHVCCGVEIVGCSLDAPLAALADTYYIRLANFN